MLAKIVPKEHRPIIVFVLVLVGLLIVSCGTTTPDQAEEDTEESMDEEDTGDSEESMDEPDAMALEGNAVRGGQLYDEWWAVAEAGHEDEHEHEEEGGAPEGDHPLWSTQSSNERSGDDTWRCKECHGWDYKGFEGAYGEGSSHYTGFVGVAQVADMPASEVLSALQGGTNPDHDFSAYMEEQDLVDLAVFLTTSLIDPDEYLDGKASTGDAGNGENLYTNVCTLCHGPGGNAINFHGLEEPEFVGHIGEDNPWEFIHKVRYGQPGWPMPSGINNDWTPGDVADVLAYVQTFGTDPALSGGGPLYDKWWEALGLDAPEGDQPLWSTQSSNERSGDDTWRCKECHGWDYLGVDGVYGSGSHMTGFTGVAGASSMSSDELLAWLDGTNNPDHDFSMIPDYGLDALVLFIQDEIPNVSDYVNDDGSVNGDPLIGQGMFEGTCAACHGVDGKTINFGGDDDPEFVGTIANDNPWEFLHKVSFGQPGEPMPAGLALGWTREDITNLIAYAKTLPSE